MTEERFIDLVRIEQVPLRRFLLLCAQEIQRLPMI